MSLDLFSEAWAEAWCREINASEAYRKAAARWEGALVLVVEADPERGLEAPRAVYVDLWHGECREARPARPEDFETAPYVLSGPPEAWQRILEGRQNPLVALLRGKIRLKKGSLGALSPYVRAAQELVRAATRVETRFPWT